MRIPFFSFFVFLSIFSLFALIVLDAVLPFGVAVRLLKDVVTTVDVHDAILEVELPAVPAAGNLKQTARSANNKIYPV